MTMLEGYVISLQSRPDRLTQFYNRIKPIKNDIMIKTFRAINGKELNLVDLRPRVNPWNFDHIGEARLRGYLGNALSHLAVWRLLSESESNLSVVFEDDATFRFPWMPRIFSYLLDKIPDDADLVWLNDYCPPQCKSISSRAFDKLHRVNPAITSNITKISQISIPGREKYRRWPAKYLKTTESYIISRQLAKSFIALFENDLGAADEHMRAYTSRIGACAYELRVPIFKQFDRSDTDIQL